MSEKDHPSYGILSLSRSSIGGNGVALFGSSILHNDTIRLNISAGTLDRHSNQSRCYPKHGREDQYVEVEMSYSQFAEAITSLNMGGGVPVTVLAVKGQRMPPCPYEDKQQMLQNEFEALASEVTRDIYRQKEEIEQLLQNKKSLNSSDKSFILSALGNAAAKIDDHMPFIRQLFQEQMEKTVTEAKGEIESFLQNKMNSMALEALLKNQKQPLTGEFGNSLPDCRQEQIEEELAENTFEMGGMSL